MTKKVSLRDFIRFIMLKESQSSPNLTLSPKLILKHSKRLQAEKYCVIDKLKKIEHNHTPSSSIGYAQPGGTSWSE